MHTELCRKEVGSFQESLKDEACVVACTQEAPLFSEIAQTANAPTQLKFINIREHAGWSKEGAQATPKIAAYLDQLARSNGLASRRAVRPPVRRSPVPTTVGAGAPGCADTARDAAEG